MAETSAYLFAGGGDKTQARAAYPGCRVGVFPRRIISRSGISRRQKVRATCACVKAHLIRIKNEDERVGSRARAVARLANLMKRWKTIPGRFIG